MKSRSIRFTLTFQLTVFLLIVLTLFSALILQRFQEVLYNDTDALLRSKVDGLENSINVYWDAYKRTRSTEQTFGQAASEWIDSRSGDQRLMGIIVRIYKPDGTLIATNRKDLEDFKISKDLLKNLREVKTIFQTSVIKNFIDFDVKVRSCLFYVDSPRQDYIIQTAKEVKTIEEPLGLLQFVVILLLPVFLLMGTLVEWLLIRRSLTSLGELMDRIRNVGAENLRLRFTEEEFPETETKDLALSFNTMLDRIDASFAQQRRVFEDLSHQMKTPLAVMRGELEVALKKDRPAEEYRELLASSLEEVERMGAIVENLLKLARFDAQEMILDRESVPLKACLEELVNQMEKLADSRQVVLDLVCPDDLKIEADLFKIQQALLNLLDNAIKYARPGTVVTVKAWRDEGAAGGSTAVIWVHDFGAVIPGEELPQVFERFWRSQSTMREKGYGLGLSIVKALVEMHGGTVAVESTEEKGTAFTVRIPL